MHSQTVSAVLRSTSSSGSRTCPLHSSSRPTADGVASYSRISSVRAHSSSDDAERRILNVDQQGAVGSDAQLVRRRREAYTQRGSTGGSGIRRAARPTTRRRRSPRRIPDTSCACGPAQHREQRLNCGRERAHCTTTTVQHTHERTRFCAYFEVTTLFRLHIIVKDSSDVEHKDFRVDWKRDASLAHTTFVFSSTFSFIRICTPATRPTKLPIYS